MHRGSNEADHGRLHANGNFYSYFIRSEDLVKPE